MQFKNDAKVYTSDEQEVGKIDRVVIDPITKELTHVIVRKGALFVQDKVVPISLIDQTREDHVTLRGDMSDYESLADFEERHFIVLDNEEAPTFSLEHAQPMYWYPSGIGTGFSPYIPQKPYFVETRRNIPEQTVAVKEGAKVISVDGKHVGDIEHLFVDSETDRVTTFLVSKGFFLKEHLFIPIAWVAEFGENEIKLAVGSRLLERQARLIETMRELDNMQK
ncbi:MAG: DUF2171 domain-containing protein [Chloroflexi bacterium]|nr:DUF2171 domain-containing protein [Chloroflexota bacterium]